MAFGLKRKQLVMLAVLLFGAFVTILNQTVVTPALPTIMAEMSIDAATAQWLTTGFTLVNAIMIPITAYLTDRFPVRKLFGIAMTVFAAGSLLAGWGPNFAVLLLGRLVQAAGAGVLMPMVMTVMMVTFPVDKRGTAMGVFGLVIAFAPAVGPTVAGIVIDQVSWHVMFFAIAVLTAIVIAVALFTLEAPATESSDDVVLDKISVVQSSLGFGCLLYGLSAIGSYGPSAQAFIASAIGLVALVFFFRRQLRMERPMLQVRVLANKRFLVATIIGMLAQASLMAGGILMPIYIQSLAGYSATVSGLVMLPGAVIMGALGPVAGRLFDKHGPRALSLIGLGVLTATTIAFAFFQVNTLLSIIVIVYTLRMVSLSLVNMPVTTWGMNSLDNKLMNHGTSVNNTLRMVAGSLGTAIIVSANTMVTDANVDALGQVQASMLGINVAFFVSAALCLIGFVLAIVFVRNKPAEGKDIDPRNEHKTVLQTIMKRDVFSVPETATVAEAMKLLVDKGISAAPIVDASGKAVGFISDGDVMRCLRRQNRSYSDPIVMMLYDRADNREFQKKLESIMELNVKEIGNTGSISVDIHADLPEVCRVLGQHHLKKVPVMEDGHIVGMVNRSDITQYSMKQYLEGK